MSETKEVKTPLHQKLDEFVEQLFKVIAVICVAVWAINIGLFNDQAHGGSQINGAIYYFKIAVASIPEGFPAVITTCCLWVLVWLRKTQFYDLWKSVETLGCTTVICSDKSVPVCSASTKLTGLTAELTANSSNLKGPVTKYQPLNELFLNGSKVNTADFDCLQEIGTICTMCDDSAIHFNEFKQVFEKVDEATEAALIVLAEKLNLFSVSKTGLDCRSAAIDVHQEVEIKWKKELPLKLSRDRKSMSSYCVPTEPSRLGTGPELFVKGAHEGVLDRCTHARVGISVKFDFGEQVFMCKSRTGAKQILEPRRRQRAPKNTQGWVNIQHR